MTNAKAYTLTDFDYHLPPELIAQEPLSLRDSSRLLVVRREKDAQSWEHGQFRDLPSYLLPGDVLVLNDTKVIPARFWAQRASGASLEVLLLRAKDKNGRWEALLRPGKRAKGGETLRAGKAEIKVLDKEPSGKVLLEFASDLKLNQFLEEQGVAPLPPYIKRPQAGTIHESPLRRKDLERYQTVYAQREGAVAAPTAGLHFTPELLNALEKRGVEIVYITLHVGWGTFKPVTVNRIREHLMEAESYSIDDKTAAAIIRAKKEGRRVVAVGTTTVRALESSAQNNGLLQGQTGESTLFIYPPYQFKIVDAMITNFHLPQSTLLMLVSAFAGKELIFKAYQEAIKEKYRFYSYGDAMLIL